MKRIIILGLCALLPMFSMNIAAKEAAKDEDSDKDFLTGFVVGEYYLIGKSPDAENTYHGQVEIDKTDDGLKITRVIAGKTVYGTATIEDSMVKEAQLLRMRFSETDAKYEETCLIDSDLDNYARISCYLYRADLTTENPGFEALFIMSEDD